jgi:hypothetical protein
MFLSALLAPTNVRLFAAVLALVSLLFDLHWRPALPLIRRNLLFLVAVS